MRLRFVALSALLSLFTSLALLAPGATPRIAAQGSTVRGPNIGAAVTPKSFDGDVRKLPQINGAVVKPRLQPRLVPHPNATSRAFSDPVQQQTQPAGKMPAPIRNFKGLDFRSWGAGWPPDPNGDVGPNHYIQAVNVSIGIFDKTGARLAAFTFDTLWSAAPGPTTPCDNSNQGDPVALYDALANRWVITDFGWASLSGPFYECIAVSKSGDPMGGGWWFYPILFDNTNLNDYPKLVVWPDAYYMSANMFVGGFAFNGVRALAFDRSKMISGQIVQPVSFDVSAAYSTLLPANLRGALPPSGSPEYFAAIDSPNTTDQLHVWKFHFDPTTPSNSWFGTSSGNTNPVDVSVAPFVEPCNSENIQNCVPEKGANSSQYLDSLGDRLMMSLQYRNINGAESLWANHSVANSTNVGSQIGLRWYQLDVTGGTVATTPVQQSTFKPSDGIYRWIGSLAVDKSGNMALGYSASSTGIYPAIRYAGRLATDPPNTLGQGEMTLIAGSGAQTNYFGSPLNRWGDYSAMTIDPADDCTFWYTNEYYAATGYNWQTRIGSFKFPGCGHGGPFPNAIEEFNFNVQYDGWQGIADPNASGGSYRVSHTSGDIATLVFTGNAVKWVYRTGPDEGNAQVAIDGVTRGIVNLYAATPQEQVMKQYTGLAYAAHTLTIKVLGTTSGSDTKVVVDAFVVGGLTKQDTDKSIKYNSWAGVSNVNSSGGMFRYSQTLNAVATFHFTGTAVKWITLKGPTYGMAQVSIDGVSQGAPIDLYAPALQGQVLFSYPGLTAGSHTVRVQVLHTKNPLAVNYRVAIDAFLVTP